MEEFSWKHDLNLVLWRPTLLHNLMRATAAGLVVGIVLVLTSSVPPAQALTYPIIWPIGWLILMLPLGLITGALSRVGVPWVGLVNAAFALCVAIGDPIVYLLNRIRSDWVLVERPGFFTFSLVTFVVDEEKKARLKRRALDAAGQIVDRAIHK